ncbi:MAG TPA: family 1 glycosylhydrolase [Isosphaeraceae bacterium]|jgi:beta-glucosidase/6-phospho-beta-glucosidase/beta-galactosidase
MLELLAAEDALRDRRRLGGQTIQADGTVDAGRPTRPGGRAMSSCATSTSAADFRWAVGIENTFIPQTRAGHRRLDEYELMDHYRLWRGDIDLAADLGISSIRYGIPWYKVNPRPGVFDWSWTDEVLEHLAVRRGLTPIVDLMHYGTPMWLENGFVNASYPRRVAEYAARFAERYGSLVRWYTPLNEPAVTAAYCGRDGRWPPYLSGVDGYLKVLLALAEGMIRTAAALRAARPDAMLVHVEDVGLELGDSPATAGLAAEAQVDRLLALDLACGLVGPGHARYEWLIENGADAGRLDYLTEHAPDWDVLGVNFYPWSNRRIVRRRNGRAHSRRDTDPSALADVLKLVHGRYGLPMMVTETSTTGCPLERARWMRETLGAVHEVRSEGVPVLGYTWFPLFTMIEWKYRWSRKGLEDHLLHLGLYEVRPRDGGMNRRETALVEAYRGHIADAAGSVGECAVPAEVAAVELVA